MAIFELFSKRQKKLNGEVPDVFVYDQIPAPLRVQIVHIWNDALGDPYAYGSIAPGAYKTIHDALCREYGVFTLSSLGGDEIEHLREFLLEERDVTKVLDAVELSFRYIERLATDSGYRARSRPAVTAEQAIEELNTRFMEHGVGYEYSDGELLRKDSEFIHQQVVRPVLGVLRGAAFQGANQEFLSAHEHYRHGRYKESLNDCLKSLESTLKAICNTRGWSYNANATAKALLEICFQQGLIPLALQSEFTALRSTLESGVPTIRNKNSGHGQGSTVVVIPQHLASYTLHLTATSILFLAEASEAMP